MKFGIVQGRLTESQELQSFPKDWKMEFQNLPLTKLDYIELVAEREFNKENPIWCATDFLNKECPIICNDYIINHSINEGLGNLATRNLIDQAALIGSELVVLPMMEASAYIRIDTLTEVEWYARRNNTSIALETTEDDHPFNIVYDTGNRVDAGLRPATDIRRLGKRIAHVHIKDKDWKGDNVLLGTGDVDFKEVCQALTDIGYDGTMTFETVRGKDPIRTAKYNLEFIKFFLSEAQ